MENIGTIISIQGIITLITFEVIVVLIAVKDVVA